MSDAPLQNASINPATGLPRKADPRDVADIDRELEAYLAEKRSLQSVNLDHSVDGQLSRIKEKVSLRNEQKTAQEKVVTPQSGSDLPPIKPGPAKSAVENSAAQNTVPSHEDLIRSLEEKYSAGKETGPQNKKEALVGEGAQAIAKEEGKVTLEASIKRPELTNAKTLSAGSAPANPSPQSSMSTKIVMPPEVAKASTDTFAELKENIDTENKTEILKLLETAAALSSADQQALVQVFLPRFRRNKERKELFLRTQSELEQELRAFTNKRLDTNTKNTAQQNTATEDTKAAPKQFAILDEQKRVQEKPQSSETERDPLPTHDPFAQYVKEEKTAQTEPPVTESLSQAEVPVYAEDPAKSSGKKTEQEAAPSIPSEIPQAPIAEVPQTSAENTDPSTAVIERYKQFLINSDRKPTVLVYDPEQGFVRKAIDPNDTSLNLNFSFNETTEIITLQVLDKNGVLLSEIRTPQSEF